MNLEEEKLAIEEAKTDGEKFSALYDVYYPKIFSYTLRRIGAYDVACDITSEVFLKALTHLSRFRWQNISISSWFYRIATNEINMYVRKRRYESRVRQEFSDSCFPDPVLHKLFERERQSIERELKSHQDFLLLQKALTTLSPVYQSVLSLQYFEKKSIREIAEILDKKEGTVKSLHSRGVEMLRKYFAAHATDR